MNRTSYWRAVLQGMAQAFDIAGAVHPRYGLADGESDVQSDAIWMRHDWDVVVGDMPAVSVWPMPCTREEWERQFNARLVSYRDQAPVLMSFAGADSTHV